MSGENNCATALHQKRMLAFINHFIIKTVQFLNNFACQCEGKLLNFEIKMQKIEASLKILETKLSSIPDIAEAINEPNQTIVTSNVIEENPEVETPNLETEVVEAQLDIEESPEIDPKYEKIFKMIQVGVPIQSVRQKIIQEGLDPAVLDRFN